MQFYAKHTSQLGTVDEDATSFYTGEVARWVREALLTYR